MQPSDPLNTAPRTAAMLALALLTFMPVYAADATNPSKDRGSAGSPAATVARNVALAHGLVRYGDKSADPVALIAAARMLKQAGAHPAEFKPGKGVSAATKTNAGDFAFEAVLERARKLSDGRPDLIGLIDDVSQTATRGAVEGPGFRAQLAQARSEYTYRVDFRGGQFSAVGVTPRDGSDMVLLVFDEAGRRVCKKGDYTGLLLCAWFALHAQTYTIKVVNRGDTSGYIGYYL